jgi:arylsulfatase A-like enzyme
MIDVQFFGRNISSCVGLPSLKAVLKNVNAPVFEHGLQPALQPRRLNVIRHFILLLLTALPAAAAPNIIYIMADDMGYADAGCYGGKYVQTPTLDQMAAEGMRFTDAYSGAPVCAPARSVLMTGKHTGHTTVRGNFGKQGGVRGLGGGKGRVPLLAEDVTVAEVLKAAGYHTGMTGKWGLGEPNTSGEPNSQGFDEWFGYLNQRRAHTYYPDFIWKNREKYPLPGNTGGKKTQYTHDLCAAFALDFIKRNHAKPFFLYLPYCIPHSKLEIPDLGPYADDTKFGKAETTYAAMITRMDTDIGKMMALLKALKIDDNTIVFFCSDNGAASRYDGKLNSSGPLRGRKRDMYEGGLRVPMIVRWPGRIKAGTVSGTPWTFARRRHGTEGY